MPRTPMHECNNAFFLSWKYSTPTQEEGVACISGDIGGIANYVEADLNK